MPSKESRALRNKNRIKLKKWRQTPSGRFHTYKRTAKRDGRVFDLTLSDVQQLTSKPCAYCGGSASGIDRVINTEGYVKDNVVSCCNTCNRMKSDYTVEFFTNHVRKIAHMHDP